MRKLKNNKSILDSSGLIERHSSYKDDVENMEEAFKKFSVKYADYLSGFMLVKHGKFWSITPVLNGRF